MRLIIRNESRLPMEDALLRCRSVIQEGRISTGPSGDQYCHATTFKDCVVFADKNKVSDRLIVSNILGQ